MPDLAELLDDLDPQAELVERHLWLIALVGWLRGDARSVPATLARLDLLLDALQARPEATLRLQAWWAKLLDALDGTSLLADFGFSSRSAFVSELAERLRRKLLPATPETTDASTLFALVLWHPFDAQWLAVVSAATLSRLGAALQAPATAPGLASQPALTPWQSLLLEAITFCTSQVRAAGFTPELRQRMSVPARQARQFHALGQDFEAVRDAFIASPASDSDSRQTALQNFRARLDACRQAAASVYTHLDEHGISVNLVFQLRQLRERVLRIRTLLDCLVANEPGPSTARLLSQLITMGQQGRSLRALVASNTSMLAAKVAERSSETGEHYITRTLPEYRDMLRKAAGGGALTAVTTWLKFGVMALGLSAFWGGFWAGAVYAASFILIQLLHLTLATKQPAMTAPAMAAKLKDLGDPNSLEMFVDEVTHLVRSQVALGRFAASQRSAEELSALADTGRPGPYPLLSIAGAAMHRGNGAVALAMADRAISEIEHTGSNVTEAVVLRAAALTQLGRHEEALAAIESLQDGGQQHPFTRAVAALVTMAAGFPDIAVEHAEAVTLIEGASYLDQVFAYVAAAGAFDQLGHHAQAALSAEAAIARAMGVGDVVATALATATFEAVTGQPHPAHDSRTPIGDGWELVVRQLATGAA